MELQKEVLWLKSNKSFFSYLLQIHFSTSKFEDLASSCWNMVGAIFCTLNDSVCQLTIQIVQGEMVNPKPLISLGCKKIRIGEKTAHTFKHFQLILEEL